MTSTSATIPKETKLRLFSIFLIIVYEFCGIPFCCGASFVGFLSSHVPSFVALVVKGFYVCFVLYGCCFLSPLLVLVEKSPKLCVLIVNNLILSPRFFDFSSSLDLSVACGSDVRLRSVQKISNLTTLISTRMNDGVTKLSNKI